MLTPNPIQAHWQHEEALTGVFCLMEKYKIHPTNGIKNDRILSPTDGASPVAAGATGVTFPPTCVSAL
jgi:hypothetical protein